MSASARVVPNDFIEVFDHVPEYRDYGDPEEARELEGDFRLALGRVTKDWGDQLLDLAEHPATPLTQRELKTIDALLDRIGAVFRNLNESGRSATPLKSKERVLAMRDVDGSILRSMEETARLMAALRRGHGSNLWLKANAGVLFRRLHRMARDLNRRNLLLSGIAQAPQRPLDVPTEGTA